MPDPKKRVTISSVRREAGALIAAHRRQLATGLFLMLVSRLTGLVMPATTNPPPSGMNSIRSTGRSG